MEFLEHTLYYTEMVIKLEMDTHPLLGVLMIIFLQTLVFNSFIPAVTVFNILIVYILQNPTLAWMVLTISCVIGALSTNFFLNICCRHTVDKAIQKSKVLKVVKSRLGNQPYKLFFLIKLIALPEVFLNLFIGAVDLDYKVLVIGNTIYYSVLCLKYCIIGSEVREIRDIVKKPTAWADKTQGQKIGFVLMTSIIVLNVFFAGFLVVKIKSLLKQDDSEGNGDGEKINTGRSSMSLQELPSHDEEEHISVLRSEESSGVYKDVDNNSLFD